MGCILAPLRGCHAELSAVRAARKFNVDSNNLAVTRTATGDVTYAHLPVGGLYFSDPNLIFRDQIRTQRILIGESVPIHTDGVAARRRLITHIENLITRTKILARISVAAQTPLHLQRCVLIHKRHLVNGAVTGITADSLGNVDAVIEINEVGKRIDPRPL